MNITCLAVLFFGGIARGRGLGGASGESLCPGASKSVPMKSCFFSRSLGPASTPSPLRALGGPPWCSALIALVGAFCCRIEGSDYVQA